VGGVPTLNVPLVKQVVGLAQQVVSLLPNGAADLSVSDVLRWPGVIQPAEIDLTSIQRDALVTLDAALVVLAEGQEREGSRIASFIQARLLSITSVIKQIRERLPEVISRQRERLALRLAELQAALNPDRLEQEVLLCVQRLDVEEELDRLAGHVEEVERVVLNETGAGRRLDFLMQELNREANTLGSKSLDVEITRFAVELKVFIEQMREQIQNIE
jgi:uncharacterized protein (TIGR00255 family)